MDINYKKYNSTLYIELYGELDESKADETRSTLNKVIQNLDFKQVIIDLLNLSFMDSTGIGILIGRYKFLKEYNIPIYICNPNNQIDKILKMTGIYEIMPKI